MKINLNKLLHNKKGFDPAGLVSLGIMILVMAVVILAIGLFFKLGESDVEAKITPIRNLYLAERDLRTFLESETYYGGKYIKIAELMATYYDLYDLKPLDAKLLTDNIKKEGEIFFKNYNNYKFSISKSNDVFLDGKYIYYRIGDVKTNYPNIIYQVMPLYDSSDGEQIYVYFEFD